MVGIILPGFCLRALNARKISVDVLDPLGRPIQAIMGVSGNTAVIEMASASGMWLLRDDELNPEKTTSYGTGQLIKRAFELGCRKILLGIGGSATVDGGIGMLEALGFTFRDQNGNSLPGTATSLSKVKQIVRPQMLPEDTEILVLCDVNNPLLGEMGSATVFAPQKGAGPEMVSRLEKGLEHWVTLLENITHKEIRSLEGAGAAGGIGCSLALLPNTQLVQGAGFILDLLGMDEHLSWADLVITGEGKIDRQSLAFKAPYALALKAKQAGKPVIALAGIAEYTQEQPFDAVFSILNRPLSLQEAMQQADILLAETASRIAAFLVSIHPELSRTNKIFSQIQKAIQENETDVAEGLLQTVNQEYTNYWFYKGMILKKQQRWSESINALLHAVEKDNGHLQAQAGIQMVRNILGFTNPHLLDP
jgi:glycerate 2-kinase